MSTTPTPRTDAQYWNDTGTHLDRLLRMRDCARQLEHELTEANRRLLEFIDSPEGMNFTTAQQRDTANRCVDELERELAAEREARERAEHFIEREGYRRCDIPACNCPSWHGGHWKDRESEQRARAELSEARLAEAIKALSSGLCSNHREPDPLHCDICNNVEVLEGANKTRMEIIERLETKLAIAREAISETLEENRHLADGDNCTLIRLKQALDKIK